MKGRKIYTIGDLVDAGMNHRSVVVPSSTAFAKPKPAAFVINLPGHMLFYLLERGMFVYKKESKQGVR